MRRDGPGRPTPQRRLAGSAPAAARHSAVGVFPDAPAGLAGVLACPVLCDRRPSICQAMNGSLPNLDSVSYRVHLGAAAYCAAGGRTAGTERAARAGPGAELARG